ncbi:MAG: hypothetical protein IH865_02110 [Chloroflexi bacterium]|nr:hypothetical protein [Chloroflexota bacterium]
MKIRNLSVPVLLIVSLLFVTTAFGRQIEPDVVRQDESAAQAADIALLASETGLPVESVEDAIAFQQAFAKYADELIIRFPDQISVAWMEPVPNTRGHIQFTGEVPSEVISELKGQGLLDANNVVLTGGGMISMADHARRAELAGKALVDEGYRNFLTFFDPIDKVIRIELKLPEGTAQPSKLDVLGAVQNRVRAQLQGRAATVDASGLELTVITGSGPIITNHHSRGGNWLRDDGVRECTSGWSVSGPNGDGIITAAHCGGLNQFEQADGLVYGTTYRDQEWGDLGDVEYHTTFHVELAEFYATSSSIRDVNSIKTSTMLGGSVCVYGRSSNSRNCNHTVEAVGVCVQWVLWVCNLARTDNVSTIGGDSGGGWSWGTEAWGVHKGIANGKSYFTPVTGAQAALNVTIKTK